MASYHDPKASASVNRPSGASWRNMLWDLDNVIVWATDKDGVLTMSEGGGLRRIGLSYADNVGIRLSDFGEDSKVWTVAFPAALAGRTTVTPSVFGDKAYINMCGPLHDGRGQVSGMFGWSWEVSPAEMESVMHTAQSIAAAHGWYHAG